MCSFQPEPRACGHSREPIYLDSEPDTERNAGSASNVAGGGCGRARSDKAGFQPYWGKLAVRDDQRGWGKRGQDLMAVCHDARKGRNTGSHWSKPVAPPLHSTCSLQPWTCSQVKVLPRQWMVGPSSHIRLRLGETPAGASSAVNGRACRRPPAAGGDRSAALANVQAATLRTDCRPESGSFSETSEKGVLEQPNRDRNGEGSDDREMSHQTNSVSQRGRGRSMDAKYAKAKKGR